MTTSTDLVTMLGNLSRSLFPVQQLLSYISYVLGIGFFIVALTKFKKMAESRQSQEKAVVPIAFLLGGAALLYLPSTVTALSNTTFGAGSILRYTNVNPTNIYHSMGLLIQTAGIIWFIRGSVLLIHSSEPGEQHGKKGFAFLCAGIIAINFRNTAAAINAALQWLTSMSFTFRGSK